MSTDRELLELAAKAIKLKIKPAEVKNVAAQGDNRFIGYMADPEQWPRGWFSPLTDDGDALRLAVKLRMQITPGTYNEYEATAFRSGAAEAHEKTAMGYSIEAATRRAIVRAAADIGRNVS